MSSTSNSSSCIPHDAPEAELRQIGAESLLTAFCERNATLDALDAIAEDREWEQDLARMLSRRSDEGYGADWPARRLAALQRASAKAERVSAHEDLSTLILQLRNRQDGRPDTA